MWNRKLVKEIFGWVKTVTRFRRTRHRSVRRVGWMFSFALAVSSPEVPQPPSGDPVLMSLRDELISTISSVGRAPELHDDSPLISTSLLDSLALFKLVLWIEEQTGAPIDLTTIDVVSEWDTIDGILRFIETRRAGQVEAKAES